MSNVPGYDCFIAEHQAAFEAGQVVGVVVEVAVAVVSIVASVGATTGVVLTVAAVKIAAKAAVTAVIAGVKKVVKSIAERAAVRTTARVAGREADDVVQYAARSNTTAAQACSANSFTADTPVMMADGTQKPIEDVAVGDEVVATDPQTGETAARPVVSLIRHGGQHTMVDVGLADGTVIEATDRHPFWNAGTGAFEYAIDLEPGELVLTLNGSALEVTSVRVHEEDLTAYNLEIEGIHTYYAGDTPLLVHNTCSDSLYRFGTESESAERLGTQAAAAQAQGFPHGVSVFNNSTRPDAVSASRSAIEEFFPVIKTGNRSSHFTIELPNPVTDEVAAIFNGLFGR